MSRLIIITGDLASGKSSLADSLSLRLNIPCFKKDVIKENLVDKYGFTTREEKHFPENFTECSGFEFIRCEPEGSWDVEVKQPLCSLMLAVG